jgi:outer membrane usher protein
MKFFLSRKCLLSCLAGMLAGAVPGLAAASERAAASVSDAEAESVEFNEAFLRISGGSIDVSRYRRGNYVPAGAYSVDILVNQIPVGRRTLAFIAPMPEASATACIGKGMLTEFQVNVDALLAAGKDLEASCLDVEGLIPGAVVRYDAGRLQLNISIPQISLKRQPRGFVSPDRWDDGVPAGVFNYTFSAFASDPGHGMDTMSNYFLGINGSLSLGGWRVRTQSMLNGGNKTASTWRNGSLYAQRDVTALQSSLTIGENFGRGEFFGAAPYLGVRLETDTNMLPPGQTEYAPVIRGIANSSARVEVRQNGLVIYQTTVPAGAFEIDDLSSISYGSDLQVEVIEADGRSHSFTVPYAAVPNLMRPGLWRYSAEAGRVRGDVLGLRGESPLFVQALVQRGINNWLTTYAGLQFTNGNLFRSVVLGGAFGTPIGAVSLDTTFSRARLANPVGALSGYSIRAAYSKMIEATRTNFTLMTYRYSSAGYIGLSDAVQLNDQARHPAPADRPVGQIMDPATGQWVDPRVDANTGEIVNQFTGQVLGRTQRWSDTLRARGQLQLSISQPLGDRWGSVYVSGQYYDYWGRERSPVTSYQMGYSNRLGAVSFNIGTSRTRNNDSGRFENQYFINFSLPLGMPGARSSTVHGGVSQGRDGPASATAVLSGSVDKVPSLSYSLGGGGFLHGGERPSFSGSLNWSGPYASLSGGYGRNGGGGQHYSLGASGALAVHGGGFTLARHMGDTLALVEAPGAAGATVNYSSRINSDGYALVGGLSPYRINDISIDAAGASPDVQFETTRLQVVPRSGAVVKATFATRVGRSVLISATDEKGAPLPFGAEVLDAEERVVAQVAQAGRLFVLGEETGGTFTVRRGGGAPDCVLNYGLPPRKQPGASGGLPFETLDLVCRRAPQAASLPAPADRPS